MLDSQIQMPDPFNEINFQAHAQDVARQNQSEQRFGERRVASNTRNINTEGGQLSTSLR